MRQLTFDDIDICATRHGGAATSVLANAKVHKERDRQVIIDLISLSQEGLTLFDLCAVMERLPNQISGRLTELRVQGLIYANGRRANHEGRIGRVYLTI